MTNREKYKQAFSVLHASESISLEDITMEKHNRKFHLRPALAAALAAALMVGGMGAAYAADLGGIQEKLHIWINGKQVEADVTDYSGDGTGSYTFTYTDGDKGTVSVGGGGVAIGDDGVEHPLSPEEVAQQFDGIVDTDEEGRVHIYDRGQDHDITDLLVDGGCKVFLTVDGQTIYYDIEDNGGGGWAFRRSPAPQGEAGEYTKLS